MVVDPGKTCKYGVADVCPSGTMSFYSDKAIDRALERYTFILSIGIVFRVVMTIPDILSGIEMTVA